MAVEFIKNGLPILGLTVSGISLLASLVVLSITAGLYRYHPKLMNRVTLRLQIGITLADACRQALVFLSYPQMSLAAEAVLEFFNNTMINIYCILNIAIAVNIYLLFIKERSPNLRWEAGYWKFCIVATLLLNFPSLIINLLGSYTETNFILRTLYPHGSQVHVHLIQFFGSWFGFIVVLLTVHKLLFNGAFTNENIPEGSTDFRRQYQFVLREYMKRSILFPFSFFICSLGMNITFMLPHPVPPEYIIWSVLGQASTGLFNAMAFVADPSIKKGLQFLRRQGLPEFLQRIRARSLQVDRALNQLFALVELDSSYTLLTPSQEEA